MHVARALGLRQPTETGGRGSTDKTFVKDFEIIDRHLAGVIDTASSAQLQQFLTQCHNVVGQAIRLIFRIKTSHEPAVLRSHARGTMPGMAALSLNAADRQHGFARYVHQIAAECEGQQGGVGKTESSRAGKDNLITQTRLFENVVNAGHPQLERHRDVIGKDQRSCPRATFTTVDGYEINTAMTSQHLLRERVPERHLAHGRLDANRQSTLLGKEFDKIQHAIDIMKGRVSGRAETIFAERNGTDASNFRSHLCRRQQSPAARLRALT